MKRFIQILFFAFIIKPFMLFFIGLRVFGEKQPINKHPFILIANHSSHMDTVSLLNLIPLKSLRKVKPVAAADYFAKNTLIAWLSDTFMNILPIDRAKITKENNPIKLMGDVLKNNQSIIVFPEGTRSLDGEFNQFKTGVARLIIQNPDIPIVPCYLTNMYKAMPKGELLPIPFICDIYIGESFLVQGDDIQEITELLKAKIVELPKKYNVKNNFF